MSFAMSAWWSDTLYYHPTSTSSIVHHTFSSANRNIETEFKITYNISLGDRTTNKEKKRKTLDVKLVEFVHI